MNDLEPRLSPRARTLLEAAGVVREEKKMSEVNIRATYDSKCSEDLVDVLVAFEEQYGGLQIDMEGIQLELGLGLLKSQQRNPLIERHGHVVRIATEEHADLFIDARGWLWKAGPDGEVAELAPSLESYLEQLAVKKSKLGNAPYILHAEPKLAETINTLGLTIDEGVTNAAFTFATSERYALQMHTKGSEYMTSRLFLQCIDFEAMIDAITQMSAACPGWRCVIASYHPSIVQRTVEMKTFLKGDVVENELSTRSKLRVPNFDGGALHLLEDGSIAAYSLDDDGDVDRQLTLSKQGGEYITYLIPWD